MPWVGLVVLCRVHTLSAAGEGACARGPGCTRVGGALGDSADGVGEPAVVLGVRPRVLAGDREGPPPGSDGSLQPFNLGRGAYVG